MVFPPQAMLALANFAKQKQEEKQQKLQEKLQGVPDMAVGLGSILEQTAIRDDGSSNVGQGTLAGILKGGGAGASLGPLGILGGALLGGTSGFAAANQSNADFYDTKALNEAFSLSAKTVSPSTFGKGGVMNGLMDEEEFLPVQMEVMENYVTPDLNIYDSKAKEKHEKMDDKFISDVVRNGSFAFSNRKNFKPKTYADDVIGYGFAHYSEDGNFALEQVKMGDVFGDSKKEISYSEGADMIKKMFKVMKEDDPSADLLTQITNQENKQARAPFINKLVQMHEDSYDKNAADIVPQKFGTGGSMKKKADKYAGGGPMEGLIQMLTALREKRPPVNVQPLPNKPLGSLKSEGRPPVNVQPLPNKPLGSLKSMTPNANNDMVLDSIYAEIFKDNKSKNNIPGGNVSDMYNNLFSELDMLDNENAYDFATTNRDSKALFNRMGARSGLSSIIDGTAVALQSTRVDPRLKDTRFADEMFQEFSPAMADQISNQGVARANSLISNIARDNPDLAQKLAPKMFDSALDQSNASRLSIATNDLATRRAKYGFLNSTGNANNIARIEADEATRSLINKKRTDLANVATGFLGRNDSLDQRKFMMDRGAVSQFNDNRLSLLQNRANILGQKGTYDLRMQENASKMKSMEDYFKSLQDSSSTSRSPVNITPLPNRPFTPLKSMGPIIPQPSGLTSQSTVTPPQDFTNMPFYRRKLGLMPMDDLNIY